MNKEKQIEQLENDITECYGCDPMYYGTDGNFLAKELVKMGWSKQEWISVEDRLPEENGRYLVNVHISHLAFENLFTVAVMEYGKSHGFYLYNEAEKVTHWMPLPEPPKMKGGAE